MMQKNAWSHLSSVQVGRYAEYLVKMEFTLHGLDVYSAEIDDKGIDFVVRVDRKAQGVEHYDVQVKSSRNLNYIFFPKSKFKPRKNLLAAVVLFLHDQVPLFYLIPSMAWHEPGTGNLFANRMYEGKKSAPEWGLNLSERKLSLLAPYAFENMIERLRENRIG